MQFFLLFLLIFFLIPDISFCESDIPLLTPVISRELEELSALIEKEPLEKTQPSNVKLWIKASFCLGILLVGCSFLSFNYPFSDSSSLFKDTNLDFIGFDKNNIAFPKLKDISVFFKGIFSKGE